MPNVTNDNSFSCFIHFKSHREHFSSVVVVSYRTMYLLSFKIICMLTRLLGAQFSQAVSLCSLVRSRICTSVRNICDNYRKFSFILVCVVISKYVHAKFCHIRDNVKKLMSYKKLNCLSLGERGGKTPV